MNMIEGTGRWAVERARTAWGREVRRRQARRLERVSNILAKPGPPRPYDRDDVFDALQHQYPSRNDYGWDPYSTWWRGIQRAPALIQLVALQEPGVRVLEATCGDGMTGRVLASYGHEVTLHDLDDWRDERARELPFVAGDLCTSLPIEGERFDLIFSYNALEHVADPAAALAELVRLCRRGGHLYLDFGPLYASPWGLHVGSTLHMPYVQFLFSPSFYMDKLAKLGGVFDLDETRGEPQPLNRWRLDRFEQLWRDSGCDIVSYTVTPDHSHLDVIESYPDAFRGLGLTTADVTAHQVAVLLRKRAA